MSLPNEFLKFGNKVMRPDWTDVQMSDRDLYTGYSYAAIRKRANMVARLAIENVRTQSEKQGFIHPYLELIKNSRTFSEYDFWYKISTFLDLEGVFYLMAVRNFDGSKYGKVNQFKLLSPYRVRRVVKEENGQIVIGGYIESRGGFIREIPPEMIIEMRELNPFDENEPMAMTDAAKESQFTMKTAGDYTRHTLKHNINAPGILTTDVQLQDTDFQNFVSRVKNNVKGEPIFGNGKGAIDWNSMNIDLSKSALKDVNETNRETQFAVYGVSKTIMGIEQSGTTRETAKVQKDLFIENEGIPRLQMIVNPLAQDYKNNYPVEFKSSGNAEIVVDNPNATDHDAEVKDTEAKQKKADLYDGLISKGYDPKKVAEYVEGNITIDQLGTPKKAPAEKANAQDEHIHTHALSEKKKLDEELSGVIGQQEGSLQNAIVNIDAHIVADAINRIQKNDSYDESDIITKSSKKEYINELEAVLVGFYGIVMMLNGGKSMRNRTGEFAMPGVFTLDAVAKKYINKISEKVAESHVQTVLDDILVTARDKALTGATQTEIISAIRKKYDATISETRAKAIARTETNRAFTRSQYESDRQFIKQNKLEKRAYKRWRTRSDNACAFCQSLAKGPLIPFSKAFADLGDDLEVDGKKLPINFEALEAGNAHTNCSCIYELVILAE